MKKIVLILFIGITTNTFSQVELRQGVPYTENTWLVVSAYGITFKIPAGWSGGVPEGSSALILADKSNEVTMLVTSDLLEENDVLKYLRNEIPLEQGISLKPVTPAQQQGRRWFGDYEVSGSPQAMKGYVEVRIGDFKIGAGCVVLALPNAIERGKSAAIDLLNSFEFKAPATSNTNMAGVNQPWDQYLKGKSLKFYYTQGDFTESDFIQLCTDGSFQRSKQSSSGGITGYGAVYGNKQGTWKAIGEGDFCKLLLYNQDGTQSEFEIQYREGNKGTGIYLNGSRYYAEVSNQCN